MSTAFSSSNTIARTGSPEAAGVELARRKTLLISLLIVAALGSAQAQNHGVLVGQVTDAENGQALPGANISVTKTLLGASSDARGYFRIIGVPVGTHFLKASFVGYTTVETSVRVQKDTAAQINFALRPTPIAFDQVIVTGSRQAEDLNRAANSVNVISSSEIRQRERMRIDEALQTVPGVTQVGENVNIRGGQGYSLLGLGGSRVLMLIDDVPVLTSDLGRANWDILPVSEIERIEVLKGAASVLYGSGGISGIVNIITQPASVKPTFSFRQVAGLYTEPGVPEWDWTDRNLHYVRTDLSFSRTFGPVGLRVAASRHTSTSDRENGDFQRWYFTGKSVFSFKDNSNLVFSAAYSRDARGLFLIWQDQNNALETTLTDRVDVDGGFAYLIYNKLFSPVLSFRTRLSFNAQLIGLPFNLSNNFEPALGWGGEVQANWLPHINHNITAGLDYKRDEVEAKYYGKHRGDAISPYLQETWKVSGIWQLSAGLRYDTYFLVGDSAETQLSPKLGLSYNPFSNTTLHSSFGRGFRAPSIAERFSASEPDDNVQLENNPDLSPERSTLFDAGVRQRFGENISAEITAFSNEYTDEISLIQTDPGSLSFQLRNCAKSRIQGVESEVRFSLWRNRLSILANGTWMDARSLEDDPDCNVQKDDPLPYRPRFIGLISPALRLGPVTLEGDYRYASRAERVSFFPNYERVPQKLVNLRVRYQWQKLAFLLQAKNAINYNYTIVEQNLEEIRNISFSISGDF
ncbi:MAG: TonB-dependent receptor [bacterium]